MTPGTGTEFSALPAVVVMGFAAVLAVVVVVGVLRAYDRMVKPEGDER